MALCSYYSSILMWVSLISLKTDQIQLVNPKPKLKTTSLILNFPKQMPNQIWNHWPRKWKPSTYQLVNGFGEETMVWAMGFSGWNSALEVEMGQNFPIGQWLQQQFLWEFFFFTYRLGKKEEKEQKKDCETRKSHWRVVFGSRFITIVLLKEGEVKVEAPLHEEVLRRSFSERRVGDRWPIIVARQ